MVNIVIDGRKIKAIEDSTILENLKDLKIEVPTLCYHEELSSFGACRLCTVEVKANGKWKLATSCETVVEKGMEVKTDSKKVQESRKLAAQDNDCILCGLCVRACGEVVEVSALTFRDRGLGRDIDEPEIEFDPNYCIGCGSCAYVCPTKYVKMEEAEGKRVIWDKVFKMAACDVCGRYFAPKDQLEYISQTTGVPMSKLSTCVTCK
jgi:bidirectional [NiFe] hydrogenase diaphorase subunit